MAEFVERIDRFLIPGFAAAAPDERRRARVAALTMVVLLVPSFVPPLVLRFSMRVENTIAVVMGVSYVSSLLALRRGRGLRAASLLTTVGLVASFFVSGLSTTGVTSLVQPWMVLGPLFAMVQLGPRAGWVTSGVVVAGCLGAFFAERAGLYVPPRAPYDFNLALVLGYLTLLPICAALLHGFTSARAAEQTELLRLSRLEQDAERQREQRRVIGNLAHEIANPLSAAQLAVEYVSGELLTSNPQLYGVATEARTSVERIGGLLADLRLINNLGLNAPRRVVLGDVVRAALTALPVLPVIEASLDGTVEVDGVATELQRLTTELLQNAREAVGTDAPPHRVTVSVTREGASAVLVVTDAGPGIPAALLPQLFSPFASRKSATGRRGLGLPLAHAIVGRHQGTLRVESSEGKGTRCEVRLPLAPPA